MSASSRLAVSLALALLIVPLASAQEPEEGGEGSPPPGSEPPSSGPPEEGNQSAPHQAPASASNTVSCRAILLSPINPSDPSKTSFAFDPDGCIRQTIERLLRDPW